MKKALIISCFNWYEKRLQPVREVLIEERYSVTVLMSDFNHVRKKAVEYKIEECMYIHVPEYKSNISFSRIKSHVIFALTVRNYINKINPDLIYLLMPPNLSGLFCAEYKRKHKDIILVADLIDLWPESMPIGFFSKTIAAKIWRGWRETCLAKADHVFTECGLYQKKLSDALNRHKMSTLHLYKVMPDELRKQVENIIEQRKGQKEDKTIKFAYLGSINNIIDVEGICSVISIFKNNEYKTELHVVGKGEKTEHFLRQVETCGCKTYYYGVIFEQAEIINKLARCDCAFNMMKSTSEVGLTIKSIDYFSMGLPIINNIKGDTWHLVKRYGIGVNVQSTDWEELKGVEQIKHESVVKVFEHFFTRDIFIRKVRKALLGIRCNDS